MSKREVDFCFILSDLLATTPRALRAIQTLLQQGYSIVVVSNVRIAHAVETDRLIVNSIPKTNFQLIKLDWQGISPSILLSKIIHKISAFLFTKAHFRGTLLTWFAMDYTIPRQMAASQSIKAKVYVGHRPSSLPIITFLAEKHQGKSWFDIEDEHFVESLDSDLNAITKEIIVNNPTDFYTNASHLVGESFCRHSNFSDNRSIEILNSPVGKIQITQSATSSASAIEFVWFSQSVTFGRGLEEFFEALKIAAIPAKVTLIGKVFPDFGLWVTEQRLSTVEVEYLGFVPEEIILAHCLKADVGLALERNDVDESRKLTITNKILTYAVSGNFILASNTLGQLDFMARLPDCGMVTTLSKQALADVIISLHYEKETIRQNKLMRISLAEKFQWQEQEKTLLSFVKSIH